MRHKFGGSLQDWQLLRRLDAAGCPIFWEQLEQPSDPVRVIQKPPVLGTELFALTENRTGLAVHLKIVASRRFAIPRIALSADWVEGALSFPSIVSRTASLSLADGGAVRLDAGGLLFQRVARGLTLEKGEVALGYLGLLIDQPLSSVRQRLAATLILCDQFERPYPYGLSLLNAQRIVGSGDRLCAFVSAPQLEQEREARQASLVANPQAAALPAAVTRKSTFAEAAERPHDEWARLCAEDPFNRGADKNAPVPLTQAGRDCPAPVSVIEAPGESAAR